MCRVHARTSPAKFHSPLSGHIDWPRSLKRLTRRVKKHLENMDVPPEYHNAWSRQEYFTSDTLHLEEHFDSWHGPQPFPFMSLRYEIGGADDGGHNTA